MEFEYYEEVPVPSQVLGFSNQEVIRIWKLKRDDSARFCLTRNGTTYIVGDTKIVSRMTDEELAEGMSLGSNTSPV